MFNKKKDSSENVPSAPIIHPQPLLIVVGPGEGIPLPQIAAAAQPLEVTFSTPEQLNLASVTQAAAVLAVGLKPDFLTALNENIIQARRMRNDGAPVLIVCPAIKHLTDFGHWLQARALENKLDGLRLILVKQPKDIPEKLAGKLQAFREPNLIRMPVNPEVENPIMKNFYMISPELRSIVNFMKGLAENGVTRIYLLGGPGTGKTSVAYYYWLCRKKGNFVTVNLTAESTGDKSSMKSLLCGHVTGAFPGSGSREGASAFAGEGVCFLDESHGVTEVVMEVLMEVLDSGQFLPFGATNKRSLQCAVVFASNRSWQAIRDLVNLDELARLGATIIEIPNLTSREEDMIAVVADFLAKISKQCSTWNRIDGLTDEAWDLIRSSRWVGNMRAMIRVLETASINQLGRGSGSNLLEATHIKEGIDIWEPTEHESIKIYASFKS